MTKNDVDDIYRSVLMWGVFIGPRQNKPIGMFVFKFQAANFIEKEMIGDYTLKNLIVKYKVNPNG